MNVGETPKWRQEAFAGRRAEVAQTVEALISGEIEDEELSRLLLGSALDPEFYDPSTNAATE